MTAAQTRCNPDRDQPPWVGYQRLILTRQIHCAHVADTSRKGLIVLAAIISANLLVASSAASATSSTRHIFDDTPRPLGEISLIGDSVLLGSLTFGPNLLSS